MHYRRLIGRCLNLMSPFRTEMNWFKRLFFNFLSRGIDLIKRTISCDRSIIKRRRIRGKNREKILTDQPERDAVRIQNQPTSEKGNGKFDTRNKMFYTYVNFFFSSLSLSLFLLLFSWREVKRTHIISSWVKLNNRIQSKGNKKAKEEKKKKITSVFRLCKGGTPLLTWRIPKGTKHCD